MHGRHEGGDTKKITQTIDLSSSRPHSLTLLLSIYPADFIERWYERRTMRREQPWTMIRPFNLFLFRFLFDSLLGNGWMSAVCLPFRYNGISSTSSHGPWGNGQWYWGCLSLPFNYTLFCVQDISIWPSLVSSPSPPTCRTKDGLPTSSLSLSSFAGWVLFLCSCSMGYFFFFNHPNCTKVGRYDALVVLWSSDMTTALLADWLTFILFLPRTQQKKRVSLPLHFVSHWLSHPHHNLLLLSFSLTEHRRQWSMVQCFPSYIIIFLLLHPFILTYTLRNLLCHMDTIRVTNWILQPLFFSLSFVRPFVIIHIANLSLSLSL